MKIILDDTNPNDAKIMQALGRAMSVAVTAPQAPAAQETKDDPEVMAEPEPPDNIIPIKPKEEQEVDADGVVWDEELHASTRTTTQDGRWKKRRGAAKVEDPTDETKKETKTSSEVSDEDFRQAWQTHKGRWGVDRTRRIFKRIQPDGSGHPKDIPTTMYAEAVSELNNDPGPKAEEIDMDEF